jgi:hypothetical protein
MPCDSAENPAEALNSISAPQRNSGALERNCQRVQLRTLQQGHSMEPRIPSGRYCLFRFFVAGSRSGRTVLVEERKVAECAYTLKRYLRSSISTEGAQRGGHIILRSENPEEPDIELNEDGESQDQRYAVIAEFVQVLSSPEWIKSVWDE